MIRVLYFTNSSGDVARLTIGKSRCGEWVDHHAAPSVACDCLRNVSQLVSQYNAMSVYCTARRGRGRGRGGAVSGVGR